MKKDNLFWKIAFVIVVILAIGFIYIQNNQIAEEEIKIEVQQNSELCTLEKHYCEEYNDIILEVNNYEEPDYDIIECTCDNDEDILETLLNYCRISNGWKIFYNKLRCSNGNCMSISDCNLVVQSYGEIMSR